MQKFLHIQMLTMHNKLITTWFQDTALFSELEQSVGAWRNKTSSPSCQLKLNMSDTPTPLRKYCGFEISGPKSTENQFLTQFCSKLTTRAQFNYPTTINFMCVQSTSMSATISSTRHSKINFWKLNISPLTKILWIYLPNHYPGHFLRSSRKCWG